MPPSPNKRRRIVDSEDLPEERARAPHRESGFNTAQANGAPDETAVADVDQQAKEEEEEDPEEQALLERQRIWDDFQDEYFDGEFAAAYRSSKSAEESESRRPITAGTAAQCRADDGARQARKEYVLCIHSEPSA